MIKNENSFSFQGKRSIRLILHNYYKSAIFSEPVWFQLKTNTKCIMFFWENIQMQLMEDIDSCLVTYYFGTTLWLVPSRLPRSTSRGWTPHMKGVGMLVGNFELKSIWAWPKLFLIPKRDNVKTRATLNETFTAKYDGVLPRTRLWTGSLFGEKRPKSEIYTSKRADELPHPFHMRSSPPLPGSTCFCLVPLQPLTKPVNVAEMSHNAL